MGNPLQRGKSPDCFSGDVQFDSTAIATSSTTALGFAGPRARSRCMMQLVRRDFLGLAASASLFALAGRTASAQATRPLAERLADYAGRLRYGDLDAATIERVKSHVIDTLGCGIGALDEPPVRVCQDVALAPVGRASTVIGTSRRTTPDLASFANGAAFRYYDLNDTYATAGLGAVHPSDHIAACLAVAESERASAAEQRQLRTRQASRCARSRAHE
ncbi:MAG TPA: MmgE/PrpD family protein [Burkholderiaceae bacterium]|nr:MmgE/PrpD family protein [Burkholderiaceae bacterium]